MPDQPPTSDLDIRNRELDLKEIQQKEDLELRRQELSLKQTDVARTRWVNPLVIAVLAAAAGAFGNAGVAWLNGIEQRRLEDQRANAARDADEQKAKATLALEQTRSEAARIFEVVKTGDDPDRAASNLKFLVDVGLVSGPTASAVAKYVESREKGKGFALPATGTGIADKIRYFWYASPDNQKAIRDWLAKNGEGLPFSMLIRSENQGLMLQMMRDLRIP